MDKFFDRVKKAKSVSAITGAGISQESGVPTFRGKDGLWKNFKAEELATPEAFRKNPTLVWEWYGYRRKICSEAKPNPAHLVLAEMENFFPEFCVITQNVDGLHERAGSEKLIELHGNIWKARCTACNHIFRHEEIPLASNPVFCPLCNQLARPHIVWFGESYDQFILSNSMHILSKSEITFVIGTSGMVSMPVYLAEHAKRHGSFIVEINLESTPITEICDLVIREKAGTALVKIRDLI